MRSSARAWNSSSAGSGAPRVVVVDLEHDPGPVARQREQDPHACGVEEHADGVRGERGVDVEVGHREVLAVEPADQRRADELAGGAVTAVGADDPADPRRLVAVRAAEGDRDAVDVLGRRGERDPRSTTTPSSAARSASTASVSGCGTSRMKGCLLGTCATGSRARSWPSRRRGRRGPAPTTRTGSVVFTIATCPRRLQPSFNAGSAGRWRRPPALGAAQRGDCVRSSSRRGVVAVRRRSAGRVRTESMQSACTTT